MPMWYDNENCDYENPDDDWGDEREDFDINAEKIIRICMGILETKGLSGLVEGGQFAELEKEAALFQKELSAKYEPQECAGLNIDYVRLPCSTVILTSTSSNHALKDSTSS